MKEWIVGDRNRRWTGRFLYPADQNNAAQEEPEEPEECPWAALAALDVTCQMWNCELCELGDAQGTDKHEDCS